MNWHISNTSWCSRSGRGAKSALESLVYIHVFEREQKNKLIGIRPSEQNEKLEKIRESSQRKLFVLIWSNSFIWRFKQSQTRSIMFASKTGAKEQGLAAWSLRIIVDFLVVNQTTRLKIMFPKLYSKLSLDWLRDGLRYIVRSALHIDHSVMEFR